MYITRNTAGLRNTGCQSRASQLSQTLSASMVRIEISRVSDDRSLRNAYTSTLYTTAGLHAAHMWLCACQTFNRMSTVLLVCQTPRKPSRSVVEANAELTFPTSALAFAVIVSASTE